MNHHRAALDAAKEFLEFVRSSEKPTLRGLAMRLDTLATLMWPLEERAYGATPKRATSSYNAWREVIAPRFPMLGFYSIVLFDIADPIACESGMGDAVDDLADICLGLEEALWIERKTDETQGAQHLCWSCWSVWGEHLRGLQRHLYDLMRPPYNLN
jgi:hypothetical protein